jgi:hypothetical protein
LRITDRGLLHLHRFPDLSRLDLSHTFVSDVGLRI